eukprot:scaffold6265_cov193-Cylindrotheca_fusiformis.AAC.23
MTSTKPLSSSFATSAGEFESTFADGLDISEFDTSVATPTAQKGSVRSAAADLLRVKEIEKKQREEEEAEEGALQVAVQERASIVEESLIKQKRNSGSIVADALVKMHGQDTHEPSYRSKKMGKRRSGHRPTVSSTKPLIARKPRRAKHSTKR